MTQHQVHIENAIVSYSKKTIPARVLKNGKKALFFHGIKEEGIHSYLYPDYGFSMLFTSESFLDIK